MQRQNDSVNLMTFIKPHQSGFLLSIILAVISVTSGIVPYFAVARIVNLLIGDETNYSTYLTWGIVALITASQPDVPMKRHAMCFQKYDRRLRIN